MKKYLYEWERLKYLREAFRQRQTTERKVSKYESRPYPGKHN